MITLWLVLPTFLVFIPQKFNIDKLTAFLLSLLHKHCCWLSNEDYKRASNYLKEGRGVFGYLYNQDHKCLQDNKLKEKGVIELTQCMCSCNGAVMIR